MLDHWAELAIENRVLRRALQRVAYVRVLDCSGHYPDCPGYWRCALCKGNNEHCSTKKQRRHRHTVRHRAGCVLHGKMKR